MMQDIEMPPQSPIKVEPIPSANIRATPPQQRWKKTSVDERLVDGEKIVKTAIIHAAIYWKAVAVFILSILVALFIAIELGIFLAIVSIIMGIYAVLKKEILMLALTDKRILARYGMLQVDVVDIHFDKIESIELDRMWLGYLFGYSNIVIMGTGNRFIVIPYVANGIDIRRAYNEMTLNKQMNVQAVKIVADETETAI